MASIDGGCMRTLHVILAALSLALASAAAADPAAPAEAARPLDLRALYVARGGALVIAPAVEALNGKAVRVRGFMVQIEEAPTGCFYLATHPVEQDESGGGTGDLPVDSLLVRVPELADQVIPWRASPVEVVGRLEVGREEEADGRVSAIRLILTGPAAG
jgi:hypothetical protein